MHCLVLHGMDVMRSELCGRKLLSVIRSGLHFPLEMLSLYHQDISKLTSIFFFLKQWDNWFFPSNFFPVTKMIMKNNLNFEFFFQLFHYWSFHWLRGNSERGFDSFLWKEHQKPCYAFCRKRTFFLLSIILLAILYSISLKIHVPV